MPPGPSIASGIVLARLGLLNEAEPILRKVYLTHTSDNGPDAEVDEALARCYLKTFQLRAADEVIRRWLIDDPGSAKACFWKAEVERHKADPDQDVLISLYERVMSLDQNHDQGAAGPGRALPQGPPQQRCRARVRSLSEAASRRRRGLPGTGPDRGRGGSGR